MGMGVITAQGRELTEMTGSSVNGCNGQVSQVAGVGVRGNSICKGPGADHAGHVQGTARGNTTGAEWGGRS